MDINARWRFSSRTPSLLKSEISKCCERHIRSKRRLSSWLNQKHGHRSKKKKKVTFSFCDLTLFLRLSQFTLKSPHTSPVVCISCWGKAGWVEAIGVSAWKMAKGGTGMLVTLEWSRKVSGRRQSVSSKRQRGKQRSFLAGKHKSMGVKGNSTVMGQH